MFELNVLNSISKSEIFATVILGGINNEFSRMIGNRIIEA